MKYTRLSEFNYSYVSSVDNIRKIYLNSFYTCKMCNNLLKDDLVAVYDAKMISSYNPLDVFIYLARHREQAITSGVISLLCDSNRCLERLKNLKAFI